MKETKNKLAPMPKAKLVGEISEKLLKTTNDPVEQIQILDAIVSFVMNWGYQLTRRN